MDFHSSAYFNTFVNFRKMMKRYFLISSLMVAMSCVYAQGNRITLQTPSYDTGLVYLTYHMGKNLNLADSGRLKKGVVTFSRQEALPPGIYSIVYPGKTLTSDFFIDKGKDITIIADTSKLSSIIIKGEKENDLFLQYQRFIASKGAVMHKARMAYMSSKNKADSVKNRENYDKLNEELIDYRNDIIKKHPESMMAAVFKAMKDPVMPEKKPKTHQDSVDNYNYYKSHYWDGVTFMDARIIRTPFFLPKLERYYRDVIAQDPDTIINDIDYKLLYARNSPEMFKFMLNWLTDEYLNPKYMGQDAVFVHLFNKYHSKGLSPWLNEKQMETVSKRAYMQMLNQIGEKAANMEFLDPHNKVTPLWGLNADYTIVIFWDPTCGHCKEEIPRIDSVYRADWKEKNVRIYAVLTEDKFNEWTKYISDHHITDWTHVYQTKEMVDAEKAAQRPGFRQAYDILSTPTLYLLDKDKNIIGKKLSWSQLNDILHLKWNSKKN
jgi:thiol-disulfide isomerase/thioredoxin